MVSVRQVVFNVFGWGSIIHLGLMLSIPKTADYRIYILSILAFLLAGLAGTLNWTKRTLPVDKQMPSWGYFAACIGWIINGVFFSLRLIP